MRWRSWSFQELRLLGLPGLFCLWLCGARLCGRPLECVILWTVEIIRFSNMILKTLVLVISWNFCHNRFWTVCWCKIPLLARTKRLPAGWQTQLCSGDKAPVATKWRPSPELSPFWVWLCPTSCRQEFQATILGLVIHSEMLIPSFWGCSCGSVMRQDPTKSSTSMVWQCPFAVPAYLRASRVVVQYPSSGWTFTMLSRMFTWSMPGRWLIHGRVQGF